MVKAEELNVKLMTSASCHVCIGEIYKNLACSVRSFQMFQYICPSLMMTILNISLRIKLNFLESFSVITFGARHTVIRKEAKLKPLSII